MSRTKWNKHGIRAMKSNPNEDKDGMWEVYWYAVTKDDPERIPPEDEIQKVSNIDYKKALEIFETNTKANP